MQDKKFVVYKSSAGSGKTHTLVREYLKLVIAEPEKYRNILAITFTNKAADEMRQRVLGYLKQLAALNKSSEFGIRNSEININSSQTINILISELAKNLNLSEEEISRRAGKVLTIILHNYSDFAIGTIDSFVHRIIRTFAHDLYIPVNFSVEMDEDILLDEAIDILISNVGKDIQLTELLVEFTESKTDDERSWHIENDIKNFARALLKEEGQIYLEKIKELKIEEFFALIKKAEKFAGEFEDKIIVTATHGSKLITDNNLNPDSFYQGRAGIAKYFGKLTEGDISYINPNSYVNKTIEEDKWYGGKASTSDKNSIDSVKDKLTEYFKIINEAREKEYGKYILMQQISQNLYPIAVLNEIKKIIDDIKAENNILHISEFNKLISGIVLKEPVPFIYERTGEKYKHYLIDEFQDTSTLQWQNLLPLIDNSLSENNFNMIVGDGKQAIYRWRSGDVEQFNNFPKISSKTPFPLLKERELMLTRNFQDVELDKNFRSKKNIVDFNNRLFELLSQNIPEKYKGIYDKVEQKYKDDKDEGYIQIEFIDTTETEETFDEINLRRTEEIIKDLIRDGFRHRDIAILCRSNKNASLMAQYLLIKDIDVVSSDSLLLSNSPSVNFILACLRYINSTDDKIAETEIVNFLVSNKNIKSATLHEELGKLKDNGSLSKYLKEKNIVFEISKLINLNLYDLCEILIRIFSLNNSKEINPSISFFLDAAFEFSTKNPNNITDFMVWWDEKKDKLSLIVPGELDAVRVMSIHKSKGLQFPIVIYPFASERLKNTKDWLWVDVEEEELKGLKTTLLKTNKLLEQTKYAEEYRDEADKSYLDLVNLLYVTMTRAEERIYVLSKKPGKTTEEQKSVPDIFTHYLKNIDEWEDTKTVYTFGKAIKYIQKEKSLEAEACNLNKIISNDWRKEIIIKTQSPEYWDTEEPDKKREFGNLVHSVFSKIAYKEDLENVLSRLDIEGIINAEEKSKLKDSINKILSNPAIKPFFERQPDTVIKNEAEILNKEGQVLRPDRLILNDKKAVIIEYKTGKPDDYHLKQIDTYAELLSGLGYAETEKYLIYLEDNIIKKVS